MSKWWEIYNDNTSVMQTSLVVVSIIMAYLMTAYNFLPQFGPETFLSIFLSLSIGSIVIYLVERVIGVFEGIRNLELGAPEIFVISFPTPIFISIGYVLFTAKTFSELFPGTLLFALILTASVLVMFFILSVFKKKGPQAPSVISFGMIDSIAGWLILIVVLYFLMKMAGV